MKLFDRARKQGIGPACTGRYLTAWRWFKAGKLAAARPAASYRHHPGRGTQSGRPHVRVNVRGLVRGRLSRSVADGGWGAFRRMLAYKARWYGSRLIVAPRGLPSTRLCSRCGCLGPKMPLSHWVFRCEACGREMDQDLNAALNLRLYGLAVQNGPTGSSCGRSCVLCAVKRMTMSHRWERSAPRSFAESNRWPISMSF